jgi:hypothetical protein
MMIFSPIQHLIEASIAQFDTISEERKALLAQISSYISAQVANQEPVRLVYICTHNSRQESLWTNLGRCGGCLLWYSTCGNLFGWN